MYSFSLENLKRDKTQNGLYNLFFQTYIDFKGENIYATYVKSEEVMRLDKISERIYGSTMYIEELMQLNNILNIWNISEDDIIFYCVVDSLGTLKALEQELDVVLELASKPNKNTRIDPERITQVPPSIKPKALQTLTIDKEQRTIKINGKLS
jgi:hypothetical protein